MKKSSGPCQTASQLSEPVRRHIHRLAVATILVGVGLLALACAADAEIVYTPDNVTISGNGAITLPSKGPVQFTIHAAFSSGTCGLIGVYQAAAVTVTAATGAGVVAGGGSLSAAALSDGDPIGPGQSFVKHEAAMADEEQGFNCGPPISDGFWCNGKLFNKGPEPPCRTISGYLGLEVESEGSTYYGWAYLVVAPAKGEKFTVNLTGYAFETVPGMTINAGQTTEADDSSALRPGPVNRTDSVIVAAATNPVHAVSLGTFVLGTQEAPLLRRKESAGAASENS